MRRILYVVVGLAGLVGLGVLALGWGWLGRHEGPGKVTEVPLPDALLLETERVYAETAQSLGASAGKQILFGDLHVHSTFSPDAFLVSLPLLAGEGAHPPADACDFARYCSGLDFWSINDHAAGLTPKHWQETVESIRQCNAVAEYEDDPDVVAFLGWEWTHVGSTPENHWGHKNVILRHLDDENIPTRPIGARRVGGRIASVPFLGRVGFSLLQRDQRTLDFMRYIQESVDVPECPADVPVRDLPADCRELTSAPAELYAKLDDWGHESIVIPHGTAWGNSAPPGSYWDTQIANEHDDPRRQTLVEVYSGHGNSEEYRDFRDVIVHDDGTLSCPEPTPGRDGFLPACWRAGQIIRARCREAGSDEDECERRAVEARQNYLDAGKTGFRTVPGAKTEEWLDAGQCKDCFLPSFDYRPQMSVQYMMARRNFSGEKPGGQRFGFIASSDVHSGRPGTGYKEVNRREMTEAAGMPSALADLLRAAPEPRSRRVGDLPKVPYSGRDTERLASFFTTGGLVAVHAFGRDRDSLWDALGRREVYGTSGGRTLLWFDLLNPPGGGTKPMGSEVALAEAPRFRVRAAGARKQQPGCSEVSAKALGKERLYDLCRDECHHPSDERKRITRVEVVRIRPQIRDDEDVGTLIEDPWRTFDCPAAGEGCVVEFADEEFTADGRSSLYYVRAIEEPSEAVNGANLRCRYDAQGNCVSVDPCFGDETKTPYEEDCLTPIEERAWSSPIWVDVVEPS